MNRRKRQNPNYDRKRFSRTAKKVHRKNGMSAPMRGGYRL